MGKKLDLNIASPTKYFVISFFIRLLFLFLLNEEGTYRVFSEENENPLKHNA